jgi:hypothetical protein
MAWMHVDIRAIQEILATPDVEFSLNALRSALPRLTGSAREVDLQALGDTDDSPCASHKRVGISEARYCGIQGIKGKHIGHLTIGSAS